MVGCRSGRINMMYNQLNTKGPALDGFLFGGFNDR